MKRLTFSLPWPLTAEQTAEVFKTLFHLSMLGLICTHILEALRTDSVAIVWPMDIFLWLSVVTGVAMLFVLTSVVQQRKVSAHERYYRWSAMLIVGFLGASIVFLRLPGLGLTRLVVTALVTISILLLSIGVIAENEAA